jgi:hypothetical protein
MLKKRLVDRLYNRPGKAAVYGKGSGTGGSGHDEKDQGDSRSEQHYEPGEDLGIAPAYERNMI